MKNKPGNGNWEDMASTAMQQEVSITTPDKQQSHLQK